MLIDISSVEGSEIVLECRAIGKPTPTMIWYKDGLKLLMEDRMLCYTDRRFVTRLTIMNTTLRDTGSYSCEAVNSVGKDFTHCSVRIIGKLVVAFFETFFQLSRTDIGITSATKFSSPLGRSASPLGRSASPLGRSASPITVRPPTITRPLVDTTVTEGKQQ